MKPEPIKSDAWIREPLQELRDCACCPRNCHANRAEGKSGYCWSGAGFGIASLCIHRGEEPVISGPYGICNIFFTRCNLQCVYCQNFQISRNTGPVVGEQYELPRLLDEIEGLLGTDVPAVGFVSPSHYVPQMKAIIRGLEARGRTPTYVYNCGGYDKVETLRSLEGIIPVYMPDLKYMDSEVAGRLSGAADYPEVAAAALREMFRQTGPRIVVGEDGYIQSGLVVRHLVLPGYVENSLKCLRFLAEELSPEISLSLMAQYHPNPFVTGDPVLRRRLSRKEYERVLEEMERLGFENGWTQRLESSEYYDPDFEREHPFE